MSVADLKTVGVAAVMGALGNESVWHLSGQPSPHQEALVTLPFALLASCLLWFLAGRSIRNGRMGMWRTVLFSVISPAFGAILAGFLVPVLFLAGIPVAVELLAKSWYIALPFGLVTGALVYLINRPIGTVGGSR